MSIAIQKVDGKLYQVYIKKLSYKNIQNETFLLTVYKTNMVENYLKMSISLKPSWGIYKNK